MELSVLRDYGIDYESGVSRCMNNEMLYKRILLLFLQDKAFPNAEAAYKSGDYKAMFASLHELKGTCGNVGMTGIYKPVTALVELVRGDIRDDVSIQRLFNEAKVAYERAIEGICHLSE